MFQLLGALGPLVPKLAELIAEGQKFHASALSRGEPSDADRVAAALHELAKEWHPEVNGVRYLDDHGTRRAGVRFLAGIAVKIVEAAAKGQAQRVQS
jgi:hypothetical protein